MGVSRDCLKIADDSSSSVCSDKAQAYSTESRLCVQPGGPRYHLRLTRVRGYAEGNVEGARLTELVEVDISRMVLVISSKPLVQRL